MTKDDLLELIVTCRMALAECPDIDTYKSRQDHLRKEARKLLDKATRALKSGRLKNVF